MADTAGTTTALADLFKKTYEPVIQKQFNNNAKTLSNLEQVTQVASVTGGAGNGATGNWVAELYLEAPQGIGSRGEMSPLPDAQNETYKQGSVAPKYNYATLHITGQLMKLAKSPGAFGNALTLRMKNLTDELKSDLNRQILRNGSGFLATAADNADCGSPATGYVYLVVDDITSLKVGMMVDIYDWTIAGGIAGATVGTAGTAYANKITAINKSTKTVELYNAAFTAGTTCAAASAHRLVLARAGAGVKVYNPSGSATFASNRLADGGTTFIGTGTTDYSTELMGFAGIADDGLWTNATGNQTCVGQIAGLSRVTYSALQAYTNNSVGTLTELDIINAVQEANDRSGDYVDVIISTNGVERSRFEMLQSMRAFNVNGGSVKLQGGYDSVPIRVAGRDIPWVVDKDCPAGTALGINYASTKLYQEAPVGWATDFGPAVQQISGYDAGKAYLSWYCNLFPLKPCANFKLAGITEAS